MANNRIKIIPDCFDSKKVDAFFSTRNGGYSQKPYDSMNVGFHVGDDRQNVIRNRKKLFVSPKNLVLPINLTQQHSDKVVVLNKHSDLGLDYFGDAVYTKLIGVPCAVMTADCVPILLSSIDGNEIAACHAGWRGLLSGVIANTLECFSSPKNQIIAWIGPSISSKFFEVKNDVVKLFEEKFPNYNDRVISFNNGKFFVDMQYSTEILLLRAGVKKIKQSRMCTYENRETFFSYRRDHVCGRHFSSIVKIS
ncbi:hypothetical protein CF386_01555 [Paraphotobacterium marinum]|uniref:Purine nucleoside phosphorylase n=1 Tax=Paraphotobacterium marinum TaxID=1755811 RepID=A0A220VC26_9GAMM|nr:peptidoglycan editing factor PgeF [Paraphotobacterium marinum]ASK77840.1 hypothetical protein CF386_01555 [Paraphotobacterium marinum]